MRIKTCAALAILFLSCAMNSIAQTGRKISKSEAIQIAEQFIIANGYTDLPPMADKSHLSYESCCSDGGSSIEEILKRRYNTLERIAYGARLIAPFKKNRDKLYWYVAFRYREPCEYCNPKAGRVVEISEDGSSINMAHQDFDLKTFAKNRR